MDYDFIYRRHSVRQFTEEPVSEALIEKLVQAATAAPSGKNKQNWHFVAVTDPKKIQEIARLVEAENSRLAGFLTDEAKIKAFKGTVAYHTVFKGAPVLILAYAGPYETVGTMLAEAKVMAKEELHRYYKPNPGIQKCGRCYGKSAVGRSQ